ncbi:MAG: tRNA adenosine(34) deaminase TadA [Pseudomonadota bacterium]|nr:tRNA adenosine(34) deaminase TadA [Pseudomonadota bacterium]
MSNPDHEFMALAMELAKEAELIGEVPIGAIVVSDGKVVGRGRNGSISRKDPTAHAEIEAMREAAIFLNNYRLTGTTLYTTLEPCVMCAGAMIHARVKRLVYACKDPKAGAAGSVYDLLTSSELNHKLKVSFGVLESEGRDLLQSFFQARR